MGFLTQMVHTFWLYSPRPLLRRTEESQKSLEKSLWCWRRRPDLNRGWRFCRSPRPRNRSPENRRNLQIVRDFPDCRVTTGREDYERCCREWDSNGTVGVTRHVQPAHVASGPPRAKLAVPPASPSI
jgi:hypothetical protein